MKIFLSILLAFSIHIFSDDHKKLDPIIFMLDLSVNDGKIKKAEKFTYDITKNVMKMEPDTVIYQYYFDSEEKVFLYEVYKSNEAAIEHVKNFRGSKWESKFGELFSIENFAVLGEASKDLKESLEGYTTDFRYLKGGFHKPAKKLSKEIMKL
ncbi:hypothetical protein N9V57_04240 [SAR86 cluster bacterium]|nr:hypothetical protein [SAR86 cluster bacterium]